MDKLTVRDMKLSDVPEVHKIGMKVKEFKVENNTKGFWPIEKLKTWVKSKNDVLIVAEINNKIVGFAMFSVHEPTRRACFDNAWVSEKHRGRNIASTMYNAALKELKTKGINYIYSLTKENAISSIKFQEKTDFRKGYKFVWLHKFI